MVAFLLNVAFGPYSKNLREFAIYYRMFLRIPALQVWIGEMVAIFAKRAVPLHFVVLTPSHIRKWWVEQLPGPMPILFWTTSKATWKSVPEPRFWTV